MLQQNQKPESEDPLNKSYESKLHAAKLAAKDEVLKKPEQAEITGEYTPPSGDDYVIDSSARTDFSAEDIGDTEETSDFEAGYNSAVGDGSFLKEKLISWATGIFSPPGTGPMFGSGASLIQWIFREEERRAEIKNDTEET